MANPSFAEVIKLSEEEENRIREYSTKLLAKSFTGICTYPLTLAKTLFQLGHEPYPLSTGKVFVVAGREAYFLPNAFKYLGHVYKEAGLRTLFTGVDAGILANAVGGIASFATDLYLDRYYPELGGEALKELLNKDEDELTDHQSFRIRLRQAIRDTLSHSVGLILSRPLTVVMVREIAQLVGAETKYKSLLGSILSIGYEEGPGGYFSGLVPALIAEGITIWGAFFLRYSLERAIIRVKDENAVEDENSKKVKKDVRHVLNFVVPFFVNSFSYPFQVISTIMSTSGSGLVVSLLPYSPTFDYWGDAYGYLKPYGLSRGARLFLREQKGAVSVGVDHQLYASNKHFL